MMSLKKFSTIYDEFLRHITMIVDKDKTSSNKIDLLK